MSTAISVSPAFSSTPKFDEYPFEEVARGMAPFPLSTFDNFIYSEQAGENLDFYREVDVYKKNFELKNKKTLSLFTKIMETYIVPGSEGEINISGDMRESLLEAKASELISPDVFNEAQRTVFAVNVASDKYPRFLDLIRSTNLNDKLATGAQRLGRSFLFLSVLIVGTSIGVQYYAESELERRDSRALEIMNNRFWRLLAFPFLLWGIGISTIAKTKLCIICSYAGSHYATQRAEDVPRYSILIYREIKLLLGRSKAKERMEIPPSKSIMDDIAKVNKDKSRWIQRVVIFFSIVLMVGILLLPPNKPKFF
eukprot:CAMPEP_0184011660 /NCGR_PEP_ID=MMETSP0954-20121128/3953_1 /TAXON_ID=627963 /ORGANISM="Aplanochytrium sp, Strain PBS07" /LENGTH=310 /DNA_ID=CAMNT_0026291507 /DNA_START=43 /DNA_END=974 /DNA_ORIENTATION=-